MSSTQYSRNLREGIVAIIGETRVTIRAKNEACTIIISLCDFLDRPPVKGGSTCEFWRTHYVGERCRWEPDQARTRSMLGYTIMEINWPS